MRNWKSDSSRERFLRISPSFPGVMDIASPDDRLVVVHSFSGSGHALFQQQHDPGRLRREAQQAPADREGEGRGEQDGEQEIARPPLYVPETAFGSRALEILKEAKREMVLVVDQFGL